MTILELKHEGNTIDGTPAEPEKLGAVEILRITEGGRSVDVNIDTFNVALMTALLEGRADESGWMKHSTLNLKGEGEEVRVSDQGVFCKPTSIPFDAAALISRLLDGNIRRDQMVELASALKVL